MPNFSIALTGLQADTVALNTIGNNLANLNTTAYKKQSTTFEDLFYQNIGTNGANDGLQVGVGTKVSGTATSFAQGSLTTTESATDMALNGNGFFLVGRGKHAIVDAGGRFYAGRERQPADPGRRECAGLRSEEWRRGSEWRAGEFAAAGGRDRGCAGDGKRVIVDDAECGLSQRYGVHFAGVGV